MRSGRVKLSLSSPEGKSLVLQIAGPGEMLGLGATLSGRPNEVQHMMKEEQILFPYVTQLEECESRRQPMVPPRFGTAENPIRMMMQEHETLYHTLQDFEQDLHQHIHLENNILFPRALEMEDKVRSRGGWGEAD